MSENVGTAALYALMLILPLSALLTRRIPLGTTLKMALAWVAIFIVGIVLVGQRDRVAPLWQATRNALVGPDRIVTGGTVRLRMAADGHFWADVSINGVERRMLIDSGATTSALSVATAAAAHIDISADRFPRVVDTANGQVVARTATIDRMALGAIEAHGLPVVVSEAFGDSDVLGMNFLSRLHSWRVEQGYLILEPKPAET